jgi:hypothetical protein
MVLMGRVDPKQIPKTVQLFQVDLLELICAVGMIEDTDEYWEEVFAKCHEVYSRHENKLAKKMVQTVAEYLEEQSRKKEK